MDKLLPSDRIELKELQEMDALLIKMNEFRLNKNHIMVSHLQKYRMSLTGSNRINEPT